jgi:ABC-2 type transport system ATP-binding protein
MSAELAIDVRGLTKQFGGRKVVDDVAIQVKRGEICGFLGPNGSGKTTTIRMLCGLLEPDAGAGTCLGHDIRRDARRIKRRVGYMTQRFGLYEDLSIQENLDFVARAYGMPGRKQVVREALAQLGLEGRRTSWPARCPAAGSSAWRWPPACCTTPNCCCWTNPPPASTRARGATSGSRSTPWRPRADRARQHALHGRGRTLPPAGLYLLRPLLAAGTAEEVIAAAGLQTWELRGAGPGRGGGAAGGRPRWMVVPFGTALHVSAARGADLPAWLAERAPQAAWRSFHRHRAGRRLHLADRSMRRTTS